VSRISRDFTCSVETCQHQWWESIPRSEDSGVRECPECGGLGLKVFRSVPNSMFTAMPDGTDRGDTYRKIKEAAKLETEMYNLPREKRGEHQKQIKELKKV